MQIDAVSPNAFIQEQSLGIHYNETSDLLDYLVDASVFHYADGYVALPTKPGLGIEIDETVVRRAAAVGHKSFELSELVEEAPIASLVDLVKQQLGGWPMYLMTNVTGHDYHERQREGRGKARRNGFGHGVNHFNPRSPLYEFKDEHLIWLSDLGLAITIGALVLVGRTYGWANLALWYGAPYLWVNHWLGKF